MAYIIENVNLLKENQLEKTSLLIKDERIESVRPTFNRFTYMRVNASPFIMTPAHTIFNPEIPFDFSFQDMKKFYIDEFINRGCTMFLTNVEVDKEYLLKSTIKRMKTRLLNSPIDFTIGVSIPVKLLTPSFIRKCKKEKVPAIFIKVDDGLDLYRIPWGWIREAMFPYNCPLVPIYSDEKKRKRKRTMEIWKHVLTEEKIPHLDNELGVRDPISHSNLCKMGIYPVKSGIQHGGEVSYNFYMREEGMDEVSEEVLVKELNQKLKVTVHKGTVIRAEQDVLYRPGFGEYITIKTPSFFTVE